MLEQPTLNYITSQLPRFSDYADADASLRLVFSTWPRNNQMDQVLAKVVVLNRLYSTTIYDVHGIRVATRLLGTDECRAAAAEEIKHVFSGQR